MRRNVQRLAEIAAKPTRTILGLMSGTSIDGLDLALCRFHGHGTGTRVEVLHHGTVPYTTEEAAVLRRLATAAEAPVQDWALVHSWLARLHARQINGVLQGWGVDAAGIDLLASHGQTIRHAPRRIHNIPDWPDATLQIGDGDHLAVLTGIITLSDFRMQHVARGGEGAPLAGIGDELLYRSDAEDRILLNMGGIANLTWLARDRAVPGVTFDTGPANTLLDAWMRERFGLKYDEGGRICLSGSVDETLLARWLDDPYFSDAPPKTTGPERFHLDRLPGFRTSARPPEDLAATLAAFTADSIVIGIQRFTGAPAGTVLYASGGGLHNDFIMRRLATGLPTFHIKPFQTLGIHPDAKEAVLFALLANEQVAGEGTLGKISFP